MITPSLAPMTAAAAAAAAAAFKNGIERMDVRPDDQGRSSSSSRELGRKERESCNRKIPPALASCCELTGQKSDCFVIVYYN